MSALEEVTRSVHASLSPFAGEAPGEGDFERRLGGGHRAFTIEAARKAFRV